MYEYDLNSEIVKVKLDNIQIGKRIRQQISNIENLALSLKKHGLLQPIILDENLNLVAGYRRILAAKELKWEYINTVIINTKAVKQKVSIEVDENRERVNFTPDELEKAAKLLHKLEKRSLWEKIADFGKKAIGKVVYWQNKLLEQIKYKLKR